MIKVILLIVFCILSIFVHFLCKSMKEKPAISAIAAIFSVLLLVATIVNVRMINSENEAHQMETHTKNQITNYN